MIKCEICNSKFKNKKSLSIHLKFHKISSKEYYDKYLKNNNEGICYMYDKITSCKKYTMFKNIVEGYRKFCSNKCSSLCEDTKTKSIKTCLSKYGVEFNSQIKDNEFINKKSKKLKDLAIKNIDNIIQYFNKHNEKMKNDIDYKNKIVNKRIDTINKRYTKDEIINKRIDTINKRYTKDEISSRIINGRLKKTINKLNYIIEYNNLELISKYETAQHIIIVKCKECGNIFKTNYFNLKRGCGKCKNCFPKYSNLELEIKYFLKSFNVNFIENSKDIIDNYELDLYVYDKSIAIEVNGLYWHSEKQGKDKYYHLNKTNKCLDKNIKLIHIFEDEWIFKQDIVKSRLKQILGLNNSKRIHARKCEIKEISPKIKNKFLNEFHIQGEDRSSIKLGAFYDDELISVMTFSHGNISKGSKSKEFIYELNRFCSDSSYHIPGIASKFLSYFKQNYKWKEIYSYADRRWSDGNVYKKIGFDLEYITKPNYFYTKGLNRIHRFNLRKLTDEPKDIPEWILRQNEGYYRIWDCGHYKFGMKND